MYRFYEGVPGILAWATIALLFLLSSLIPAYVAVFIILFDIYWLLKTLYLSFHLRSSFREMRKNLKISWLDKLIQNEKAGKKNWKDIYHLIILPMVTEPYEVVAESFDALVRADYPKDKFLVVLGTEERAKNQDVAQKVGQKFGNKFFRFLVTIHPDNIPGERRGKGSNETWSAKQAKKHLIDRLKIPYDDILVSVFDVDTQVPRGYFSRLTYSFLTAPRPQRSSFQPIPLFTNNIFDAPALARVISFSTTFWQMMQQSRPERLTTFSSHSMPFRALVEVGFWNTGIVSEDSQIFWQCYLHYGGDWRVVPLFYPVTMDANAAPSFWQTMKNLYKQQRRWSWGCENIPYMLSGFSKNKKSPAAGKRIPLPKKLYWGFNTIEGFHSWATNALIIFALGWLPILLGGRAFNFTVLSYNLPAVTRWLMTLSMVGIATSAVLSVLLLPPKPDWFRPWHYFLYFIQWSLMPLTLIVFGSIPALDAQTRLMLGGRLRLGFWVTPKRRLRNQVFKNE